MSGFSSNVKKLSELPLLFFQLQLQQKVHLRRVSNLFVRALGTQMVSRKFVHQFENPPNGKSFMSGE